MVLLGLLCANVRRCTPLATCPPMHAERSRIDITTADSSRAGCRAMANAVETSKRRNCHEKGFHKNITTAFFTVLSKCHSKIETLVAATGNRQRVMMQRETPLLPPSIPLRTLIVCCMSRLTLDCFRRGGIYLTSASSLVTLSEILIVPLKLVSSMMMT